MQNLLHPPNGNLLADNEEIITVNQQYERYVYQPYFSYIYHEEEEIEEEVKTGPSQIINLDLRLQRIYPGPTFVPNMAQE